MVELGHTAAGDEPSQEDQCEYNKDAAADPQDGLGHSKFYVQPPDAVGDQAEDSDDDQEVDGHLNLMVDKLKLRDLAKPELPMDVLKVNFKLVKMMAAVQFGLS